MTAICADRRSIEARPDAEGERIARETAAEFVDAQLRMARALMRIERNGTFHLSSCSSIVQYGVRLGLREADARMLVDLGRALEASDTSAAPVEERVREGALSVDNAALVGKLLAKDGAIQPGEDWLAKAETTPTYELRRDVNERLEQVAQGVKELVPVTVHVTETARAGFARARVVASRAAEVSLTDGQTFALLVNHYLDAKDELRRGAKARRVGDTAELPGERYVPASARRDVLDRSHDRCEVPGCALRTFLEFAHVRAHADGGSRESDNLLRLCSRHHVQLDAGFLQFDGWDDGHPQFRDAQGRLLTQRTLVQVPHSHDDLLSSDDLCRRSIQNSERPPPWGQR